MMIACSLCDFQAFSKGNLTFHLNSIHFKDKEYMCRLCHFKTAYKGALTRHVNSVHLRTGKTKECPICGYVTSSLLNLNSHLSTSHHLEIATAFARPCGSTTTRNKDEGDVEEAEADGEGHVNGRRGSGGHIRESPPSVRSLREEESPLHPLRPDLALSRGVPPSAAAAAAAVAAAHHRQQQLAAAAAAAVAATTAAATGHLFSHPAVAGGLAAAAAAARHHQPPPVAAAAHAHFAAAAAASPAAQLTAHHLKQLSAEVAASNQQQKSPPPLPQVFYDCRFCDFKTREREQLVAHYNLAHLDSIYRELSHQRALQNENNHRLQQQQQQHQPPPPPTSNPSPPHVPRQHPQPQQHPGEEEVVSFLRMKYLRNQQRRSASSEEAENDIRRSREEIRQIDDDNRRLAHMQETRLNNLHHPSRLDRSRSPDQPLPLSLRRVPPRSPSPPPPAHHHPHHRYPPDPILPPRGVSITPPDSDSPPAAFLVSPEALRCRLCEFQASSPAYLKNHIRTVHLEEVHTLSCPACEYTSDRTSDIDDHYDLEHGSGSKQQQQQQQQQHHGTAADNRRRIAID